MPIHTYKEDEHTTRVPTRNPFDKPLFLVHLPPGKKISADKYTKGFKRLRYNHMAIVKHNPILEGLSGIVGRSLVFRQFNGKTVAQSAPVRIAPYTAAQRKQQSHFKEAMAYARIRMKNPVLKARYVAQAKLKGGSTNPFNMAIAEYFRLFKMRFSIRSRLPLTIVSIAYSFSSEREEFCYDSYLPINIEDGKFLKPT